MLCLVRPMHRHVAILLFTALISCGSPQRDLSPEAGRVAARRDIAARHLRLYIAGTETAGPVGVKPRDRALVSSLPEDRSLPIGCTVPRASEAVEFARAYNQEIIGHLRYAKPR
jgi:hypothetical protein